MAKKKPIKKLKPAKSFDEDEPKPKLRRVREDDEAALTEPKTRNDVFTGLAALSLIALLGAAYFFYQDHEDIAAKSLSAPAISSSSGAAVTDTIAPKGKN